MTTEILIPCKQYAKNFFTLTHLSDTTERLHFPTPVLLPWESQGQGSLVGCSLWGRTESDTTEVT